MNTLIILPILLPLCATGLMLILPWRRVQIGLNLLSCAALFAAGIFLLIRVLDGGIVAVQLGNWPAPFGITFVADTLSAVMITITGLTSLLVAIYGLADIERDYVTHWFYPLYQVLLMGVCGAFLTGDIFNLFVWFEVMLMSSFVLLALGGKRNQLEGGMKYLVMNFLSSGLFLTAIGILYAETATLNMADMAMILREGEFSLTVMTSAMLLLVAFGIKAAVFPLFSWLPASYHTPKLTVIAIFGGLLTKVGVYSLIRVFTLIFVADTDMTHQFLIYISILTMVTGVLGAAAQFEMKRLLAFHIVSQIGYMTLGLGLFTAGALGAALFYVVHNILAKTNLFLLAGAVERIKGTTQLKEIGGLYRFYPWLAFLFLIPAMALAGMPPLSGFFGKFVLVAESTKLGVWLAVIAALGVGLLTLYSMVKIWAEAFWKADPKPDRPEEQTRLPASMWIAMVAMAAATLAISLSPEWFLQITMRAGEELMDPDRYIRAVMEVRP